MWRYLSTFDVFTMTCEIAKLFFSEVSIQREHYWKKSKKRALTWTATPCCVEQGAYGTAYNSFVNKMVVSEFLQQCRTHHEKIENERKQNEKRKQVNFWVSIHIRTACKVSKKVIGYSVQCWQNTVTFLCSLQHDFPQF